VDTNSWLAERFEENRTRLRSVAYRMLGSLPDAEDAIQEVWLRLSRTDAGAIENLGGWLTTAVARVSLDMLRWRKSRREDQFDDQAPEPAADRDGPSDPEQEALLGDSVGLALLVVLDALEPAERLAFVLHDMFAVPFDEIAVILDRSPAAARQLASRARRRVQGRPKATGVELTRQREVVDAFLLALRAGDFQGLIAVLDPNVVVRTDRPGAAGAPMEIRGAETWARGAVQFGHMARFTQRALVDGAPGLVVVRGSRLIRALSFQIDGGRIVGVDVIADPERLRALEVSVLDEVR